MTTPQALAPGAPPRLVRAPDAEPHLAGKRLWALLNLENMQHSLLARIADMVKNLQGVKNELEAWP